MEERATLSPPVAATRCGTEPLAEKIIAPSLFQVPPAPPPGAGAKTCGSAAPISMRLSWPAAKKPMERLSGDQKGKVAPSVPGIDRALVLSRGLNQSRDVPS